MKCLIVIPAYNEADNIEKTSNDNGEISFDGSSGEITITLEPKEKNE